MSDKKEEMLYKIVLYIFFLTNNFATNLVTNPDNFCKNNLSYNLLLRYYNNMIDKRFSSIDNCREGVS